MQMNAQREFPQNLAILHRNAHRLPHEIRAQHHVQPDILMAIAVMAILNVLTRFVRGGCRTQRIIVCVNGLNMIVCICCVCSTQRNTCTHKVGQITRPLCQITLPLQIKKTAIKRSKSNIRCGCGCSSSSSKT